MPLLWRFDNLAGSGAHGDLNAHIIDMTRFVTGQEIVHVAGAIAETFIKERTLTTGIATGRIAEGRGRWGQGQGNGGRHGAVSRGSPAGRWPAQGRPAGHRRPEARNTFKINGTKGSISSISSG